MLQKCNTIQPWYVKWFSIILGAFLSLDTIIIYLFPSVEGVDTGGTFGQINIVCLVLFLFVSLKAHLLNPRNVPGICIIIELMILIYLVFTVQFIGEPLTPVSVILVFSLVSFLLPHFCEIDTRLFLKTMMLLSIPAVFRINDIFFKMIFAEDALSTGYSYSFMKPVVISIVYLRFYFKDERTAEKILTFIAFAINMVFAGFLVAFGSRAPVVAILLLLCGIYFIQENEKKNTVTIKKNRLLITIVSICLVLIFFIPILQYLQNILKADGISLNFIDKFLDMNDRDNITSDRDEIYKYTIQGIKEQPLFGYGIDQFFNNTGRAYPHNFFLQMLYDCGCFIAALLFIPQIINFIKKIRFYKFDEFVLIMALFFASVPGALFSNDLWANNVLWVFFGFMFSKRLGRKTTKINSHYDK